MSSLTETLFLKCPYSLQRIGIGVYGLWWYHRRFNSRFHQLVEELRVRERWTADQFNSYQERELSRLLERATESPYYHDVFKRYGVTSRIEPFLALKRIPILTKETLRTQSRRLLTSTPSFKTKVFRSSGTTGTPTAIYYTSEFHSWEMALTEARCHEWAGLTYRSRRVMFGARKVCAFDKESPPFWHFSPAENLAYASIYHLSEKFLPSYLEFLRNFKPDLIEGYPSALAIIARYAVERNFLPHPTKAVFTCSESLTDTARNVLERAWQCRVTDRYGAVEGCLFVSQCEFGSYHITPEAGIVEIVDAAGQPVRPGIPGEVVCTGLKNLLQPLIRYKIGDIARWSVDQNCPCGRNMPILEGIEGRIEDLCWTPDGRQMLRFDSVFKGISDIKEAQVVQDSLEQFTVYVVPSAAFGQESIDTIRQNMYSHVGNLHINVKCINAIPRNSSGKFQAVVCKLSQAEKDRASQLAVR